MPLQTIIPIDKYFKKANCRRVVKGFIVLMGYSKNRQIKRQAGKSAPVKHEYFTCPQVKALYTVEQSLIYSVLLGQWPGRESEKERARVMVIKVWEECIVLFRYTLYEKMN